MGAIARAVFDIGMNKQNETIARFGAARVVCGPSNSAETEDTSSVFPTISVSKRIFDIVFASVALTFFLPFMIAISAVLLLCEGGPVLFRQTRIGHRGKPFGCLKFRTMVVDADTRLEELLAKDPAARAEWDVSQKLTYDPRVSCIGNFLRKSSLDELPQFFNVLRGDMSVVGPRPIIADEIEKYRENILEYKSVRPGITGAWQISGRNDTTYAERVQMDTEYVRNPSLLKDLEIVFRTANAVLSARGAR